MFRKGLAKKITTVIIATSFSPYVIVYEAKASTEAPSTSKDDISTGDSMMVYMQHLQWYLHLQEQPLIQRRELNK